MLLLRGDVDQILHHIDVRRINMELSRGRDALAALAREAAQGDILGKRRRRSQRLNRLHHRYGAAGRADQVLLINIVVVDRDFQTLRKFRREDDAESLALGMRRTEEGIDLITLDGGKFGPGRVTG